MEEFDIEGWTVDTADETTIKVSSSDAFVYVGIVESPDGALECMMTVSDGDELVVEGEQFGVHVRPGVWERVATEAERLRDGHYD